MVCSLNSLLKKTLFTAGLATVLAFDVAHAQVRDIFVHHTYDYAEYSEKDLKTRYEYFVSDIANLSDAILRNPLFNLLSNAAKKQDGGAFATEYTEVQSALLNCTKELFPKMASQAQSGSIPDTFSDFERAMSSNPSSTYIKTFLDFVAATCNADGLQSLWGRSTVSARPDTYSFYRPVTEPCYERFLVGDWYFSRRVEEKANGKIRFQDIIGKDTKHYRIHFNLTGGAMSYEGGQVRVWIRDFTGFADRADASVHVGGKRVTPFLYEAKNKFGGGVYFEQDFAIADAFNILNGFRSGGKEMTVEYKSYWDGKQLEAATGSETVVLPDAGNLMRRFSEIGERLSSNVSDGSCDAI